MSLIRIEAAKKKDHHMIDDEWFIQISPFWICGGKERKKIDI